MAFAEVFVAFAIRGTEEKAFAPSVSVSLSKTVSLSVNESNINILIHNNNRIPRRPFGALGEKEDIFLTIKEFEIIMERGPRPFAFPDSLSDQMMRLEKKCEEAKKRARDLSYAVDEVERLAMDRPSKETDYVLCELSARLDGAVRHVGELTEELRDLQAAMEDAIWAWGEE